MKEGVLDVVSRKRTSGEPVEVVGGGDEANMAERLREIAERLAGARIDLLGEETEVVGEADDLVEEFFAAFTTTGASEKKAVPSSARASQRRESGAPEPVLMPPARGRDCRRTPPSLLCACAWTPRPAVLGWSAPLWSSRLCVP
jgi:hypothetical protein